MVEVLAPILVGCVAYIFLARKLLGRIYVKGMKNVVSRALFASISGAGGGFALYLFLEKVFL